MSAGWEVGDLALCINDSCGPIIGTAGERLAKGRTYTVEDGPLVCWTGQPVLVLAGIRSQDETGGFNAERFVKVTPPDADEFDRETIALMNGEPVEAENVLADILSGVRHD